MTARREPLLWTVFVLAAGACKAELPAGRYTCEDGRCPPGQYCHADGLCRAEPAPDDGATRGPLEAGASDASPPREADGGGLDGSAADGGVTDDAGPGVSNLDSGVLPDGDVVDGAADPCAANHGGCDPLATCMDVEGQAVCGACPAGYEDVASDGSQCRDIDECATDQHGCDATTQRCENLQGGRACPCLDGFHPSGSACTRNLPCLESSECAAEATCQDAAGHRVCVCNQGYEGDGDECADLDECAEPNRCGPHGTCTNTEGGHDCACVSGYRREADACVDIDECAQADRCGEHGTCANTQGGHTCGCVSGYRREADACVDVDECEQPDRCGEHGTCTNTQGGFDCGCVSGYERRSGECVDVDECAQPDRCGEHGTCTNTDGGHDCGCEAGYERESGACVDIDECEDRDRCGEHGRCTNTDGGHRCGCVRGYRREADACIDIDECVEDRDDCSTEPDACNNEPGGFDCACPAGYTGSGRGEGSCSNIDECAGRPCGSGPHRCDDGIDTYTCTCAEGYTGTGSQSCTDTDECSGDNVCTSDYPCSNRTPGYVCTGQLAEWPMPDPQPGSINSPSYTSSSDGEVVTDNITRLSWQTTPSSSNAGCTPERTCNRDEARDYCDALELGGRDNWRLPTKIELESILDYGLTPARDPSLFPNLNGYIWTSSPCLAREGYVWLVDFNYGDVVCYAGSSAANLARALCVRGPS